MARRAAFVAVGGALAGVILVVANLSRHGAASLGVSAEISGEVQNVLRHAQGEDAVAGLARRGLRGGAVPQRRLTCVRLPPASPRRVSTAREAILPSHLLPRQVLAEHDLKKGAWGHGISDQVVREFDSVFSPHHQRKGSSKVARVPLGAGHALRGAKHETDKGNFLLKMGLVNKGGYVRVWVPDTPKSGAAQDQATATAAAASRPGAVARAAPGEEYGRTPAAALQIAAQVHARRTSRDIEPKGCNPALELGCTDANNMAAIGREKKMATFFPKDAISMAAKPLHVGAQGAGAGTAAMAAAGISAAVARESKLASEWAHSEGIPQPELPSTAVAQTREAVADTLANVLREARDAEAKFGKVQENMKQLHAAISRVEGVMQRLPAHGHALSPGEMHPYSQHWARPGSAAERHELAAAAVGTQDESPGTVGWQREGFMGAERRAAVRQAQALYQRREEVRRRVWMGARCGEGSRARKS